ncbi:MAG: 16S rRNA (cytosine(1402)-N(4))-methyltransferase, partial [Candidatus Pacebacteria bacterium]|nr:16S rRNA (cytosine(1402)-N(4))-methyltransferase [Candidatus Paceibacterota bacterium]
MSKDTEEESVHKSVLLNEVIEGLNLPAGAGGKAKSIFVDGTFGGGGHSSEICKKYPNVKILAIDQDKNAWKKAQSKFKGLDCDISFHNS